MRRNIIPLRHIIPLIIINGLSVFLLIVCLNFNIRTFHLTQTLQTLTVELQDLEKTLDEAEYDYLSQTRLDHVYNKAVKDLGMHRQDHIRVFTNTFIDLR